MSGTTTPATPARPSRSRRCRQELAILLGALALACLLDAGWIHAKAGLAQVLLERAWAKARPGEAAPPPWPWADTRPVARLLAPRLDRSQIVLAGDHGRSLAFGPGWSEASATPGAAGATVVSGHRDTHFAWLRDLQVGDALRLDLAEGSRAYVVTALRVADSDHERIALDDGDEDRLLLVTCWPFDAVAGGPLRYVVSAHPVPSAP